MMLDETVRHVSRPTGLAPINAAPNDLNSVHLLYHNAYPLSQCADETSIPSKI